MLAVALCALAQTISCVGVAWTEGDRACPPASRTAVLRRLVLIAALALAGGDAPTAPGAREPVACRLRRKPRPVPRGRGGVT